MPLADILPDWRQWPVSQEPVLLETFTSGTNHSVSRLGAGAQELVLKEFLSPVESEIDAQLWAASQGLAPDVLYVAPNKRYLLMTAIGKHHLIDQQLSKQKLLRLAESLHRLHHANGGVISKTDFELIEICQEYLRCTGKRATEIHQKLEPFLVEFTQDNTQWCYCHNDLVAENIFLYHDNALFIDWEFADRHNPWFDLAAVIYYLRLSDQQSKMLLKHYRKGWQEMINSRIYYSSQLALLWCDMLWHLAKFGESFWSQMKQKESDLDRLRLKLETISA